MNRVVQTMCHINVYVYVYAASQLQLETQTPLFEQCTVQQKMSSIHSKLLSLEFRHCSTCFECFPDLTMAAAGSTVCRRCSQDKHIPKLYIAASNMCPGAVPPQLQVGILSKHFFLPPPYRSRIAIDCHKYI